MFTSEQRESAERLIGDLHLAAPELQRLRGIWIPLSALGGGREAHAINEEKVGYDSYLQGIRMLI